MAHLSNEPSILEGLYDTWPPCGVPRCPHKAAVAHLRRTWCDKGMCSSEIFGIKTWQKKKTKNLKYVWYVCMFQLSCGWENSWSTLGSALNQCHWIGTGIWIPLAPNRSIHQTFPSYLACSLSILSGQLTGWCVWKCDPPKPHDLSWVFLSK